MKKYLLFENTSELNRLENAVTQLNQSLNDLNGLLKILGQPPLRSEEIPSAVRDPDFLKDRLIPAESTFLGFRIRREEARKLVFLPEGSERFESLALQIRENLNNSAPELFRATKDGRIEPDPDKVEATKDLFRRFAANEKEFQLWGRALQASKDLVSVAREVSHETGWFSAHAGGMGFHQEVFYECLERKRQREGA